MAKMSDDGGDNRGEQFAGILRPLEARAFDALPALLKIGGELLFRPSIFLWLTIQRGLRLLRLMTDVAMCFLLVIQYC